MFLPNVHLLDLYCFYGNSVLVLSAADITLDRTYNSLSDEKVDPLFLYADIGVYYASLLSF